MSEPLTEGVDKRTVREANEASGPCVLHGVLL